MMSQWKNFAFWIGAILIIIIATFLYQPAAAKTGSLLVWTRNRVYVMDIDTLTLERVAPAKAGQLISPSPGCSGRADAFCWVLIGDTIYRVDLSLAGDHAAHVRLPVEEGFVWDDKAPASWSPDGTHVAYTVRSKEGEQANLQVFSVNGAEIKYDDSHVEPSVAVAWSAGCAHGFTATDCRIAYKKMANRTAEEILPNLVGYTPATDSKQTWPLSTEPIFELLWSSEGELLYSRPKRFFKYAKDHSPAYHIPPGAQLANLSPDASRAVYYQPFRLEECESSENKNGCLYLGVWLTPASGIGEERRLIYNVGLSDEAKQSGGLNFIPVWTEDSDAFVFFQQGQLIHYDVENKEATIWYKAVLGKLKSLPVFSPSEEAVAFVDNQGQGFSEYRLVVVNPKLQPVEHIIETESGFKILAWLPN